MNTASASSGTGKTADCLALVRLPMSKFAVISVVGNLTRPLIGLAVLVVLCFPITGWLLSGVTSQYPGLAGPSRLRGGGPPLFSRTGYFTSSSVSGCLSAGFAFCC